MIYTKPMLAKPKQYSTSTHHTLVSIHPYYSILLSGTTAPALARWASTPANPEPPSLRSQSIHISHSLLTSLRSRHQPRDMPLDNTLRAASRQQRH